MLQKIERSVFIDIKSKGKRRKRCLCSFSGLNSVVLKAILRKGTYELVLLIANCR